MARIPQESVTSQSYNKTSRIKPPEGLYSLFILKESGCPFYYQIFTSDENHPDPAILGGFFIALSLFAKEVTSGHIETVTTEPCRYTFHPLQNGLLVISSSKTSNPIIIETIAKRIVKLFLTKYRDRLITPQSAAVCAPELNEQIAQILDETNLRITQESAI
ncbi:MAG: hypothetical protein ACFFBR_05335 [Promethearchaeota archaeon]